ncbi:MAG: linear amide C-N hydrolase [Chloroflexota bacterium]
MCTRTLWNTNNLAVVVGRSMDWPESTEPKLHIFPRGIKRDGGKVVPETVIEENPARWTSRYGSIITSAYGMGSVDGMNEKGLAMNLLFLTVTDYGLRDSSREGVQAGLWGQYLLDNAATVSEALELVEGIQPVLVEHAGNETFLHLAIEDSSGDSAIIEYVEGKPHVYHGPEHRVLTNDPSYDQQLELLKQWDFTNATRETPLPGNVNPVDRFVRSNYFLQTLREPKDEREAMASIIAIARNTSVPFNAPNKTPGTTYDTEYRTALDLTNRRYFFELTTSPNIIWADLLAFDLSPDAPALVLDPNNFALSGNVTGEFEASETAPF